jgi:hypothetical protein
MKACADALSCATDGVISQREHDKKTTIFFTRIRFSLNADGLLSSGEW